jgi:NADH-quinone oxidoreductase subunit N
MLNRSNRETKAEIGIRIMELSFTPPTLNLYAVLPVLIIMGWGLLVMVLDMLVKDGEKWPSRVSLLGLVIAGVVVAVQWSTGYVGTAFTPADGNPMIIADGYVHFLNMLFVITGILGILMAGAYLGTAEILERAEYYMLLLFSISGMMLMGMSNDLIMVFLALELLSIPLYILCGMARPNVQSEESAMKYFLLGAFSSAFLLFGIALLYGATGSTEMPVIQENFMNGGIIALTGMVMLLVGFAFKIAAVPFHMWTPDVYEGAPTSVTAFMAVGAKIGGFAALIRIFVGTLPAEAAEVWVPAIAVISALTMIVGNVMALTQNNVKRMLGYSSIAQAGYILMALAADPLSGTGVPAALYYMLAYLFTTLGAFAIIIMVENPAYDKVNLEDYKGLARQNVALAVTLSLFMFSLIGIPLTGGFVGKFFVFGTTIQAGLTWLAVIGVVTSVISAFYYLRLVVYMFMFEGDSSRQTFGRALTTTAVVAAVATLILGIVPTPWLDLAQQAVMMTTQTLIAGG